MAVRGSKASQAIMKKVMAAKPSPFKKLSQG
jgi:hypothetical protein